MQLWILLLKSLQDWVGAFGGSALQVHLPLDVLELLMQLLMASVLRPLHDLPCRGAWGSALLDLQVGLVCFCYCRFKGGQLGSQRCVSGLARGELVVGLTLRSSFEDMGKWALATSYLPKSLFHAHLLL